MGRKRHTPEQIITAVREAEVGLARGKSVKLISRELGISEQTYYRWRKEFGDEGGPGTPREGARAGECTAEASGGEPDAGKADPGGSGEGKLLSPERRRRAVVHVRQRLGASERHACRVLGQSRSTQHRRRQVRADEAALRSDVVRLASRFGRYGYRRVTDMLRIEGWGVNHKRVERIWRQEGLKVPERQPKRGRLWLNDGSCRSSPELCVKVRGSSSMLGLGCVGDLLRFEKREIEVAAFAPDRSSPQSNRGDEAERTGSVGEGVGAPDSTLDLGVQALEAVRGA